MTGDIAQVFADLGDTVVLQIVSQQFNVGTGRMDEFRWTKSVQVISKQESMSQMKGVSATASLLHRQFLALKSEAPSLEELSRARLIQGDVEYEIIGVEDSPRNGVMILQCRRNDVCSNP